MIVFDSTTEDKELVRWLISDDECAAVEAMSEIHKRNKLKLRVTANYTLGKDHGDKADDIVQDVFLNVWKNRKGFTADLDIKHYLNKAVFNRCSSIFRNVKVKQKYQEFCQRHMPSTTSNNLMLEQEELSNFIRCMKLSLPELAQKIIQAQYEDGRKQKDIANELGISLQYLKNILSASLKKLNKNYNHP